MRKSVTLGIVTIICFFALLAVDRIALGQAGSTGGTIGKQDKSVSGGEEQPRQKARGRQRSSASGELLRHSLSGNWVWTQKCADDSEWAGAFDFTQNADGAISGTARGSDGSGSISGTLKGNKFRGSRCYTINVHCTQISFSLLAGGDSFAGSEVSQTHGICKYQAKRP